MALQLGIDGAYFRLGTQPAKVFLDDAAVQTVPGAPEMIECCADINSLVVFYPPPDGGSPILGYEVWVDNTSLDDFVSSQVFVTQPVYDPNSPAGSLTITVEGEDFSGLDVSVRARNAIGYGPLAAGVIAQAC
jgi:hypothetical protein